MKPRISLITLGVDDLDRSVSFYRDGLGLETQGVVGTQFEHGAVAFFDLEAGLKLALWPRKSLAHDAGLPTGQPSATEFSIAHNVASKDEVDAVMEQARQSGATIVKPAARYLLGRLRRLFPGSRWSPLGDRMESAVACSGVEPPHLVRFARHRCQLSNLQDSPGPRTY